MPTLLAGWIALAMVVATTSPPLVARQAPSTAPLGSETAGRIDAIFAPFDTTASPGCALGVSRNGKVVYARGYGMANFESDAAISPDSIFHVASISKQFAAFSVALLAADGKLSLDDEVRKHLPEIPDFGKRVTVRHLMHHTSGLRDQWALLDMAGWRDDDLITEDDVLRIVARQRALNFDPGAEYLYSNSGFTLLAIIVKRVSGQSLRAFAEARIFKPLGMTETHFHDDHTEIVRRRTSAYSTRAGGGWRVSIPVFDTYGATSLFTTVGDLLEWEAFLQGTRQRACTTNAPQAGACGEGRVVDPRVGGRELIDAMQRSGTTNDGRETGYGSGLAIGRYHGLRTVGHNGADAGYRSDVVRFPDQHLAIAALCNGSSIAPAVLTRKVAEVYLGDQMTAVPPGVTVPEGEVTPLAGTYWSEQTDQLIRLDVNEGRLRPAGAPQPLVPLGGGTFRLGDTTEWRFPAAPAGGPQELQVFSGTLAPVAYRRLTPASPSAAVLAALAGGYHSDELDALYTVAIADGRPVVRWPRHDDGVALEALGGERFFSRMIGVVTFTRGASGQVDGMTISNGRVRRLRLQRVTARR